MKSKSKRRRSPADRLRARIAHLAVDLEYAGREGDSAYSARVNKKLDNLYNRLDSMHNVSEG
jgi:hypothetical protein